MKKTSKAVLTASMCIALSVSAFALPAFANAGLKSAQGIVMEKETPKEYMNDFIAQEANPDESEIFLTKEQIQPLKLAAEKAFKEKLHIDISEDSVFDYKAEKLQENENINLTLEWSNKTASSEGVSVEEQPAIFTAYFETDILHKEPATLLWLNATGGFNKEMLASFNKQAVEALEKELSMTFSQKDYILGINLFSYVGPETEFSRKGTDLSMNWRNQKQSEEQEIVEGYLVEFSDVNLSQNTGKVVSLDKYSDDLNNQQNGKQNKFPIFVFSEAQQNEMLEAAKKFLVEKGADVGSLRTSQPSNLGTSIWFRFDVEDGSMMNTVSVTITPELKIMGYSVKTR